MSRSAHSVWQQFRNRRSGTAQEREGDAGDPQDISALRRQAEMQFSPVLDRIKSEQASPDLPWYPYRTLDNLTQLDQLLTGENRRLLELAPSGLVADIGAADGDLGFFLETLGLTVDIVDNGPTNMNGLRGARLLHEALASKVTIHEVDLDSQFALPRDEYDLAFFLGILYHLKNPYYALDRLARTARHLVISTRVARYAGKPAISIQELPVAYLLAPSECNNDSTNFWIFSETGLRRAVDRAGWDVLDYMTVGDIKRSNPAEADHDERAFALLRSRVRS